MMFKQLFAEWQDPSLKCARVGHKEWEEWRHGYTRPESFRAVADGVEQKRRICRRCWHAFSGWEDTDRYSIHSLSMPSEDMRAFEIDGEFWFPGRR